MQTNPRPGKKKRLKYSRWQKYFAKYKTITYPKNKKKIRPFEILIFGGNQMGKIGNQKSNSWWDSMIAIEIQLLIQCCVYQIFWPTRWFWDEHFLCRLTFLTPKRTRTDKWDKTVMFCRSTGIIRSPENITDGTDHASWKINPCLKKASHTHKRERERESYIQSLHTTNWARKPSNAELNHKLR